MSSSKPKPDAVKADQQIAQALQRYEEMLKLESMPRRERSPSGVIKVRKDL